jgi:hypothetical protein
MTPLTKFGRFDKEVVYNITTNIAIIICAATKAITTDIENTKHLIKKERFSLDKLIYTSPTTYKVMFGFPILFHP